MSRPIVGLQLSPDQLTRAFAYDGSINFGDPYKINFGDPYKINFGDPYKINFGDPYKTGDITMAQSARKPRARKPARKTTQRTAVRSAAPKANAKLAAEKAAMLKKTEAELKPLAKEINVQLASADKTEQKSIDSRVAAAIRLAEVKKICGDKGITFKKWAEANVTQSYETVRKLAAAGAEADPREAIAAIRHANKTANKALRDRKSASRDTEATAAITSAAQVTDQNLPPRKRAKQIAEAITALPGRNAEDALRDAAQNLGFSVVMGTAANDLAGLQGAFTGLKAKTKMEFLHWAAKQVGATVSS